MEETLGHHRLEGLHLAFEPASKHSSRLFEVVVRLQPEPEPLGGAEVPRKAERGVRCDRSFGEHDLVDPARGHAIA